MVRPSLRAVLVLTAIALLSLRCARTEAPTSGSDPKAVAIADQVMQALGGKAAWDKLTGLRWTFEVSVNDTVRPGRRHAWNKMDGWHRVEGQRKGVPFVLVQQLNTANGKAWMAGQAIEGDSLKKLLKTSQSMWINDSYWFLMPYKLRDPGVTLKYAGDTTLAGVQYDRLALSFSSVGDTPGDHYWVWVNRANHRVERWDMVLQGDQPPAKSYTWEGWELHDGLWFPTAHRGDKATIYTRNVETVSEFRPGEFASP
jgi:hypothetical protein